MLVQVLGAVVVSSVTSLLEYEQAIYLFRVRPGVQLCMQAHRLAPAKESSSRTLVNYLHISLSSSL